MVVTNRMFRALRTVTAQAKKAAPIHTLTNAGNEVDIKTESYEAEDFEEGVDQEDEDQKDVENCLADNDYLDDEWE